MPMLSIVKPNFSYDLGFVWLCFRLLRHEYDKYKEK